MKKVSVSILNSKNIEDDLIRINSSNADYIHIDVGDGSFIERRHDPIKELKEIEAALTKRLDVHLMVDNPESYILSYSELNTEYITIHCEIKKDILNILDDIKSYGIKRGLAISPDTDISFLEPFIDDIEMIIVMGVIPGKSGQSFIYNTINKVNGIKELIGDRNILISVDGGIDNETNSLLNNDIAVSETYILSGEDINKRIESLR